ncbi:hypothetical protein Tco_0933971 [Tanacetum coccineum]
MRTVIQRFGMVKRVEMDLFVFIRHSDPTKVRVGERNLAERDVKLLKMIEGRTVLLDPPITSASRNSGDSIDRLFDEGNDAGQEHSVERDDDVLEDAIAKDASEVIAEKPQKKRKRKVAEDASGSAYPPKKLRDDYQSLPPNTSGKSLAALRGMILEGSGLPSGATEPLIVASVAPMPDVGPVDSVSGLNLRTRPPHVRYVVSSDGFHHSSSYFEATSFVRSFVVDAPVVTVAVTTTVDTDVAAGSKAKDVSRDFENIGDSTFAGRVNADATSISKLKKTSTSSDSFYASQSLDTETMHHVYIPRWKVTNDSILEDPYVCRDLMDHLAPPALFAQLRAMDYDQLYSEFNVGAARQMCLEVEVRIRVEHTLEKKGELEDKVTTPESVTTSKEAELASLSSQVTKLTADLSGFQLLRDELNSKVASLESERECLVAQKILLESTFELFRECIEAFQDEQANALGDRSPEYLQALGQAIGCALNKDIKDGLKAGIDHGKAGRDLSVVEVYDPYTEEKYVNAVNALGAIDFSLLSELESKKDSSIVDLMDSLRLEGILAEISGAENLQPSLEQLMLPIHGPEDNVAFAETSLSSSLEIVNMRVQRFREEAKEKRLLLTDVMTPFVEPLSSKSLTVEASTSAAPITTLSTTFASSAVIPPSLVSLILRSELASIFRTACIIVPVDEVSRMEACAADPCVIVFLHLGFDFLLHELLFMVGMPTFTGITTSVLYVSENGVSLLLDLIMTPDYPFHQAVGLWVLNGSEALADT